MDYRISKMIEEETGDICVVLITKRGINVYDVVVIPMTINPPTYNHLSFKFYDSSANKDKYLHESIFEAIMKEMDKQTSLT